jgi:hypothetical protein
MTPRPASAAVLAAVACVALPAPATAAGVRVALDRTTLATRLGQPFTVRSTITNAAATPTGPLIAHLNVLSLRPGVYVEPEDWSSQRTRYLPSIAAHGADTLSWRLDAVNAGDLGVYVAVMRAAGPATPATGPLVRVRIDDTRRLDAGGIVPLALGIPGALAALAVAVAAHRRRNGRRSGSS